MASVIPLLFLLAVGGAFAYRGWWIYESLIMAFGFVVGVIIGLGFVSFADVQGVMGIVTIFAAGMFGASLAIIAEILAVALSGFVFGAAIGSIVPGVTFGDWSHPVILLTGLGGALLAWLMHKFVIILMTAFIGSVLISKTLVAWPDLGLMVFIRANEFSGWFFLAFLTGIMAQIGMLEHEEGESVIPDWYRSETDTEVENVPCPSCDRYVELQWNQCRYCGTDLTNLSTPHVEEEQGMSSAPDAGQSNGKARCPSCDRVVEQVWNNCQYCGTTLSPG